MKYPKINFNKEFLMYECKELNLRCKYLTTLKVEIIRYIKNVPVNPFLSNRFILNKVK